MSQKLLFLLYSFLLMTGMSGFVCSMVAKQNDPMHIIVIREGDSAASDAPRMPALVPFSAYADTDAEELILWANSNCGIINISGYNSTSGSTFSAQSTSLGSGDSFSYPVFWTSGTWTLTFTLESGDVYYGQIML